LEDPAQARMYEHGWVAHNLYTGHGFAMHWPYESFDSERRTQMEKPPQWEGAFLPPANPYILYADYLLFGDKTVSSLLAIMLLYAAINSFTPIAVYRLGLLIGTERGARTSAIVSALFLPAA